MDDNVAFSIFGFNIYWYAIMIVTGMISAMLIAALLLKKRGYKPDLVIDFALLTLPLAIIGARLYYVLTTLDRNWTFLEAVNIRTGGLAIYGGVIGGAIGVIITCKIKKLTVSDFFNVADSIIPGLILAQAIGRWGNFFNQEAYGNPVTDPKLQFFPYAVYIDDMQGYFQATFFYESFFNLIGFALLFILAYRLAGRYKGLIVSGYCIWYGIVRAIVEGLRSDSLYIGDYRVSQVLSVVLIAAGIAAAVYIIINKGIIKQKNSETVDSNTDKP